MTCVVRFSPRPPPGGVRQRSDGGGPPQTSGTRRAQVQRGSASAGGRPAAGIPLLEADGGPTLLFVSPPSAIKLAPFSLRRLCSELASWLTCNNLLLTFRHILPTLKKKKKTLNERRKASLVLICACTRSERGMDP